MNRIDWGGSGITDESSEFIFGSKLSDKQTERAVRITREKFEEFFRLFFPHLVDNDEVHIDWGVTKCQEDPSDLRFHTLNLEAKPHITFQKKGHVMGSIETSFCWSIEKEYLGLPHN